MQLRTQIGIVSSESYARSLSENYVGLPFD